MTPPVPDWMSSRKRFDRLDEYIVSDDTVREEVRAAMERERGITVESLELRKAPGKVSKLKCMHDLSRRAMRDVCRADSGHTSGGGHDRGLKPNLTWTLHFIRDVLGDRELRLQVRESLCHCEETGCRNSILAGVAAVDTRAGRREP